MAKEPQRQNDKLNLLSQIISFLIPLVGAIIYFINKDKHPERAKKACNLALWGIGFGVVIKIITTIIEHATT